MTPSPHCLRSIKSAVTLRINSAHLGLCSQKLWLTETCTDNPTKQVVLSPNISSPSSACFSLPNSADLIGKALYGSKVWLDKLDLTYELNGHNGCVNALSYAIVPPVLNI